MWAVQVGGSIDVKDNILITFILLLIFVPVCVGIAYTGGQWTEERDAIRAGTHQYYGLTATQAVRRVERAVEAAPDYFTQEKRRKCAMDFLRSMSTETLKEHEADHEKEVVDRLVANRIKIIAGGADLIRAGKCD